MAEQLSAAGVDARYEPLRIAYEPARKVKTYTPDFILPNGIIIETKGRFVSADRVKHKDIALSHPDLEIRFVFSNPNAKLNKGSKTTYAMWCEKQGFLYAAKWVPEEWIREKARTVWLHALEQARKK